MYISTSYEIGDVVIIPYTVPTPGAGTTQGIIPGEIRSIKIGETVNHEGETVTVITYGVIVDSVTLTTEDFDEIHILCKVEGYKTPYLEQIAEMAGFVTEKVARAIRIAEEEAKEEAKRQSKLDRARITSEKVRDAVGVSPGGAGDPL